MTDVEAMELSDVGPFPISALPRTSTQNRHDALDISNEVWNE